MAVRQQAATHVGSTMKAEHNLLRLGEKRTVSICSLSWIDKWVVGLLLDDGSGPPDYVGRESIMARDGSTPFRFANILEATIEFDTTNPSRTVKPSFTAQSGGYGNLSYGDIPSKQFQTIQERPVISEDTVLFTQTVGFRTESPEKKVQGTLFNWTGDPVGIAAGYKIGHQLFGLPPIWTTLALTIYFDGHSEGEMLAYSVFPSVTFYTQQPHYWKTHQYKKTGTVYDACGYVGTSLDWEDDGRGGAGYPEVSGKWGRDYYDRWNEKGWGDIANTNPLGPTDGNPWGVRKNPPEGSW